MNIHIYRRGNANAGRCSSILVSDSLAALWTGGEPLVQMQRCICLHGRKFCGGHEQGKAENPPESHTVPENLIDTRPSLAKKERAKANALETLLPGAVHASA